MWNTQDGNKLTLRPQGYRRIVQRARVSGLLPLMRNHYDGDVRESIVDSLAELSRGAVRENVPAVETDDLQLSRYRSHVDGREFELITRPIDFWHEEVMSIRSAYAGDAEELEVKRDGGVFTMRWARVGVLDEALRVTRSDAARLPHKINKGGIYIIATKSRQPLYVGQTSRFASRLGGYKSVLRKFDENGDKVNIYLGSVTGKNKGASVDRETIEHAIIMVLKYGRLSAAGAPFRLQNRTSYCPFRVSNKLTIADVLPTDLYPGNRLLSRGNRVSVSGGQTFPTRGFLARVPRSHDRCKSRVH